MPRVHGKASLRSDGHGSERGYRLLCIALPPLGVALLPLMIVLAASRPLKAQSLRGLPTVSEERSTGVDPRNDLDLSINGNGFSLDGNQVSRVGFVEGLTSSVAVLTRTDPMNASVVSPEPCTSAAPWSDQFTVSERLQHAFDPKLNLDEHGRLGENSESPSVDVAPDPETARLQSRYLLQKQARIWIRRRMAPHKYSVRLRRVS